MTEDTPEAELTPELVIKALKLADRIIRDASDVCQSVDEGWVMDECPQPLSVPLLGLGQSTQDFHSLAYDNAVPGKTMPISDLWGKVTKLLEEKLVS